MMRTPLLFSLLSLVMLSCASFQPAHPQGFAPYKESSTAKEFKAVSPEGITWRIHSEEHKPKADLAFWKPALRKRMAEAGYRIIDSTAIQANNGQGWALELAAPLGQSDFTYLVAVIPTDKCLVIVEASGASEEYSKRKGDILEALARITIN